MAKSLEVFGASSSDRLFNSFTFSVDPKLYSRAIDPGEADQIQLGSLDEFVRDEIRLTQSIAERSYRCQRIHNQL